MDSGNSGSLQSSSGADEEYDSRSDSFSAFMTKTPPAHPHIPHFSQPTQTAAVFSPLLPNYFDPTPFSDQHSLPLLNLDMAWSKTLRSDPSSPPQINPVFFSTQSSSSASVSFTSTAEAQPGGAATAAAAGKGETSRVMRNTKKRSRASRRAPTTVLTTDTTNFRAMVQEFTGIPAPPFASSPFPRTRFDIFGTPSALRSGVTPFSSSQPPYLRRPFPQKIQPPPPPQPFLPPAAPSSLVDTLASSSTNNLFGIQQNSILSSLLQSSPKYPRDSLEIPSNTPQLKMGVLDEFGSANTALSGLPSLISPDQAVPGSRRSESDPACWGGGGGLSRPSANDDQLQAITTDHHHYSENGLVPSRNVNGETNGNRNFPSTFNGDKAPGNASGRGEGMTESWICSSDLK